MLIDGTHYSHFVSRLVQEKCKPKSDLSSSTDLDRNSQKERPLRRGNGIGNSMMSLQYRSLRSLNSIGGSNNILNGDLEESAMFEMENMDFVDYEEYTGVCAMVEFPRYTELIQNLLDRGVNTQVIARSVEVYISKVVDIFTEYGADLVRFRPNKLVLVWRYQQSDEPEDIMEEDECDHKPSMRKLTALAVLCCSLARNYLKESEVWALEDISDEFSGYKIDCRFGVGFGNLLDGQVGIRGFRMEHVVLGSAYENAFTSLRKCRQFGDIFISKELRLISERYLSEYQIECMIVDDIVQVMNSIPIDQTRLKEFYSQITQNIVFDDRESSAFSNSTVETYLSDSCGTLLRIMKKEKKSAQLYNGLRKNCVFVAIRVQTHASEGISDNLSSHDYAYAYQKYLEIILKASRKYDIQLHRVKPLENRDLLFSCVAFGLEQQVYVAAIRMAIFCMELFDQKIRASIGISSGSTYEGLLKSSSRCSYRLVSIFLEEAEKMAIQNTHIGILCDKHTHERTLNHPIQGLFYELGSRDLQCGISKYRITSLGAKTDKRAGLKRQQQQNTKIAQEHMLKLQQVISATDEDELKKNILIEGNAGSGKTYTLKRVYKMLERNGFLIWYRVLTSDAESPEHSVFSHPLFPFTTLLPLIMDFINELKVVRPLQPKPFGSAEAVKTPEKKKAFNAIDKRKSYLPKERDERVTEMLNRLNTKHKPLPPIENEPKPSDRVIRLIKEKFITRNAAAKVAPAPLIKLNSGNLLQTGDTPILTRNASERSENPDPILSLQASLTRAGEIPKETLPLLNVLVGPEIPDSPQTERIGPDGRTFLLSGLLVRLIDRITAQKKLAIVIDNTQWMDSASWTILMNIVRRCKRAVIVLAASPNNSWRTTLLSEYRDKEDTESVILRGFGALELEQQIIAQLFWIDSISKELLDVIKDVSEGNPAFLVNLIKYLKETPTVTVNGKLLRPTNSIKDFQNALPKTLDDLLLWQYDSLNSKEFQKFLRVASVVGREFSLEEVAAIMTEGYDRVFNRTMVRFVNLMKLCDSFGILEPVHRMNPQTIVYPFEHVYAFSSGAFRDVVYNQRLSAVDCQCFHMKLVRYYERQLNTETEPSFIPKICYHYRFTGVLERDAILQHIQYMVMLGNYICLKAEMYKETIDLYHHIQEIIQKHDLEDVLGPNLISEIHIRLGHAYSHGLPHEVNLIQSLRHVMLALQLLNFEWPKTEPEWWKLLAQEVIAWGWISFVKPMYRVFGNPNKEKKKKRSLLSIFGIDEYTQNQKMDRLEHLQPILENMSRNLYQSNAVLLHQIGCDLLVLNNSFRMGKYQTSSDALKLSFATNFWFSRKKGLAIRIADGITEKDLDTQAYANGALFWTVCGRWDLALQWSITGAQQCQSVGDLPNWLNCTKQISFIHMYNGHFSEVFRIEKQRVLECEMSGFIAGVKQAQTTMMIVHILQGDMVDALSDYEKMESTYREVPIPLRIQYQAIFAHVELHKENLNVAMDCVERAIELIPKIHHSNTTIFSAVLLCSLALFSVVEKSKQLLEKFKGERERGSVSETRTRSTTVSNPRKPGKKPKADFVVKAIRAPDGTVSFDYKSTTAAKAQLSGLAQKQLQHTQTLQHIKKICLDMVSKLVPFRGHAITEPFVLLLRALAKQCDPTIVNTRDGAHVLRAWVNSMKDKENVHMKLIIALLAIKCWSVSNESLDYTTDLNVGMAIMAELGLDGLSIF